MKLNHLVLAAATALALAACQPANKPADAAATAAPAATEAAPATAETAPAATGATGVAECDQYLEKVYACVADKAPEAQREAFKQAIDQSKAQWSAVADKSALAAQCKAASDAAKQTYGAMGCTF